MHVKAWEPAKHEIIFYKQEAQDDGFHFQLFNHCTWPSAFQIQFQKNMHVVSLFSEEVLCLFDHQ